MHYCIMMANDNAKRSGDCEHRSMSNRTQLDFNNYCIVYIYMYTDQPTPQLRI